MRNNKLHDLALWALLTAATIVLGLIHLASPTGILTLLDVGVYMTALYLGSRSGALVGGLSAFLLDLLLGYPQYMLFSLLAHGLQGALAGWKFAKGLPGLILSLVSMVAVYALAALILGYGLGGALSGIWGNICQSLLGLFLGYPLYRALRKLKPSP